MVLQQQAVWLERWVRFFLANKETTNDLTYLHDEFYVVITIELELAGKKAVLLLEGRNLGEGCG